MNTLGINENEITPRFLECLRNTISDFENQGDENLQELNALRYILTNKYVNVLSASAIYDIIKGRKQNIKQCKKMTDSETFKIVGKEHEYMENFLNKFFIVINPFNDGFEYIQCLNNDLDGVA